MLISQLSKEDFTTEVINQILFNGIQDDGGTGDCCFVFGSTFSMDIRVQKAVEVYRQGRAPKILFSGGDRYGKKPVPEAVSMKEKAVGLGVLTTDIFIETLSNDTLENVISSLLVFKREIGLHRIKRLLIVTSLHHMSRCLLLLQTYMPSWIEYTLCPAIDPEATPENWWWNGAGVQKVTHEIEVIQYFVQEGYVKDFEINGFRRN